MAKPKHAAGYASAHADLCERVLVTLMRGLGPRRAAVYVVGGLVPRYLVGTDEKTDAHIGTTDVDLVLSLPVLADIEAYQRLEQNLKTMGFERGRNDDNQAQHFCWYKKVDEHKTIVVDLLCDTEGAAKPGHAVRLPGEKRVSALEIPGARIVEEDFITVSITAEMMDERGVATEEIRVAGYVAFLTLKAFAYDDRFEEKDAYDIVYTLLNHPDGPAGVGAAFIHFLRERPGHPLVMRALALLRGRFATDEKNPGHRKDGPRAYARFFADPARPERDMVLRRLAEETVDRFLAEVAKHG